MQKNVNTLTTREVFYYYNRHSSSPQGLLGFQCTNYISVTPSKDGTHWFASMPFQWSRPKTMQGDTPEDALMRLYLLHHVGEYIEVEEDY